jgi:putative transposase
VLPVVGRSASRGSTSGTTASPLVASAAAPSWTRVKASFDDSGGTPGTYGSPRVWEDLVDAGWRVSKKTVAASMARQGLQGRSPKRKRRSLTRPDKAADPIPDLVKRDFSAEAVDQRWCGDLTEIPTDDGKLDLATVLDLASRRLPGFSMSGHHDSAPAKAALCMAAAVRGGDVDGVVFHSDKGSEYVGDLFAQACDALGITQSMGRVGSALDKAAAESFNSTLEHELLSRYRFETRDQARREVARFIDAYNHRRRHRSPDRTVPGRSGRQRGHRPRELTPKHLDGIIQVWFRGASTTLITSVIMISHVERGRTVGKPVAV